MGPGPGPSAPYLPTTQLPAFFPCLSQSPAEEGGLSRSLGAGPMQKRPQDRAPEPVSLAPSQPTSSPASHSPYKNEAAAIFIEGPKLKIGLEHNLKK